MDIGSLVSICIAIVTISVTILLRVKDKKDEKRRIIEQRLDLKVSNNIAHNNGRYTIKIVNDSENATASGLNLLLSIENQVRGFSVNLKGVRETPRLLSKKITKGRVKGREILIKIDAMSISKSSIENLLSESLIVLYEKQKLTLANLLSERGTSLFVTISVNNDLTGLSVTLPIKEYKYDDIKTGFFKEGSVDIVPQIQEIEDNDYNS